jgi:phosphoenolpyruvate carboxykinase (GTP)
VTESFDWQHGVFLGSIMSSEKTAAAAGNVGELRFDPFAMLPFCGYDMGDYFAHWLEIGQREGAQLPQLYWVNWFRKGADGSFLWPGFGDNSRVIKWIVERLEGRADAVETPIGRVPAPGALDISGLDIDDATLAELVSVDPESWRQEIPQIEDHYAKLGDTVPPELEDELSELQKRLATSP